MTTLNAQIRRVAAAATLVAATLVSGGVASAEVQDPQQSDYVQWLQARAEAAKPYSQGEDYVRTLVYWHHNPDWGVGS